MINFLGKFLISISIFLTSVNGKPFHNFTNDFTNDHRSLFIQDGGEAKPLKTEKPLPFLLLSTSSVGSSWLMNEISNEPSICCIGNEPLDDTCGEKGKSSGNAKRQLGWLKVFLTPPSLEQYSEMMNRRMGRGDAYKAAWRLWKLKLVQHSLPCKAEEIRKSFELYSCDGNDVRVYGFKTNMFSGSMLSDHKGSKKWEKFKHELYDAGNNGNSGIGVKIIRLKRKNKLEQALNIYWKTNGGFSLNGGVFNKKFNNVKNKNIKGHQGSAFSYKARKFDNYEKFNIILNTLIKKEELLDSLTQYINLPTFTIYYEDLKLNHRNTIRKLSSFLGVKINSFLNENDIETESEIWMRDESRSLCNGIENYGEFCIYYSKTIYAEYLKDPCSPGVWDCCKCKPMQRMIFPK